MKSSGSLATTGSLRVRLIKRPRASLGWRLRNKLRWVYIWGWLTTKVVKTLSALTGIPAMTGELRAVLIKKSGEVIDYGVLGRRVVTTAFVEFVVDQLQTETSAFGDFKFHDSGIGTTAPAVGDTDIETTDGESRATGTQTESAANVYQSVGTIAYTSTKAITEWGLFNASTGVTLLDRDTFAALNVVNGESIQFTYDYTVTDGG